MRITYGTQVKTPYGIGSVVDVSDAYGVKVQYDSGGTDWHQWPYIGPVDAPEEPPR